MHAYRWPIWSREVSEVRLRFESTLPLPSCMPAAYVYDDDPVLSLSLGFYAIDHHHSHVKLSLYHTCLLFASFLLPLLFFSRLRQLTGLVIRWQANLRFGRFEKNTKREKDDQHWLYLYIYYSYYSCRRRLDILSVWFFLDSSSIKCSRWK